ncbi:hypothetical protein BDZ97DRAFT_2057619 [Flammula alnicola]|nr:hypothetical protein BDZ97DRAFT_2057619 [Flammula alnicola]
MSPCQLARHSFKFGPTVTLEMKLVVGPLNGAVKRFHGQICQRNPPPQLLPPHVSEDVLVLDHTFLDRATRCPDDVLWRYLNLFARRKAARDLPITKVCHLGEPVLSTFLSSGRRSTSNSAFLGRNTASRYPPPTLEGRPLDLTLYCARHLTFKEKEMLIIPHAHRIRRLTVHSSCGLVSEMLWKDLQLHMPLLEEFRTTSAPDTHGIHVIRKLTSPRIPPYLFPMLKPFLRLAFWNYTPSSHARLPHWYTSSSRAASSILQMGGGPPLTTWGFSPVNYATPRDLGNRCIFTETEDHKTLQTFCSPNHQAMPRSFLGSSTSLHVRQPRPQTQFACVHRYAEGPETAPLEKLTVNTAYFPYLVDMVGGDKLREFLAEAAVTVKSIDNPIPRCAIPLIERDSGSDILLFAPPYASGPPTPPLSPRTLAAQESYLDTLG